MAQETPTDKVKVICIGNCRISPTVTFPGSPDDPRPYFVKSKIGAQLVATGSCYYEEEYLEETTILDTDKATVTDPELEAEQETVPVETPLAAAKKPNARKLKKQQEALALLEENAEVIGGDETITPPETPE